MEIRSKGKKYEIDLSKGFNIIRGDKIIDHAESYEVARRKQSLSKGTTIQYFAVVGKG